MTFSSTRSYTTTADNAPVGRAAADAGAARYKEAAAGAEGPAVRHVGVQTVARATTLQSASPSPASSTTSLRAGASTDRTSVSLRNTPMHDTPKRPSSPPAEDSETTASPPAAPVALLSVSVPALHLDPRFRRALMRTGASRGVLELSPAQSARLWSIRPSRVNRISAPARTARAAGHPGADSEDAGMDDDETSGEHARDSDGEDEDGQPTPSQSAVSHSANAARLPLNFTEHTFAINIETFGAAFTRKRACERGGTGSQF